MLCVNVGSWPGRWYWKRYPVAICCCCYHQTSSSGQTQQRAARRDVTNVGDDGVDPELAAALSSAAPPLAIMFWMESARKTLSLSH